MKRPESISTANGLLNTITQVWWCPSCRIVCANEEVLNDGSHEKCGNIVEKKNLKQWMLRIPHYAE
ncbi:MAG: hypothetical protein U0X39_07855 [Bacteroidales bacterium]